VTHVTGDSRPEKVALKFQYEQGTAELVVEGEARVDELTLSTENGSWSRVDGRTMLVVDGRTTDVERTASDVVHMLEAFAHSVATGVPACTTLRDAARAIDASNLALRALQEAGVEFVRVTEPRHAATKGLSPSYS
jgi:hypothetical protein